MNKQEFSALPPNLQRDVRLAVAIGYDFHKDIDVSALLQQYRHIWVRRDEWGRWRAFEPTADRTIWGGLLEAFPIYIECHGVHGHQEYCVYFRNHAYAMWDKHLPTAIVLEVIRRDPLGHLSRSGL